MNEHFLTRALHLHRIPSTRIHRITYYSYIHTNDSINKSHFLTRAFFCMTARLLWLIDVTFVEMQSHLSLHDQSSSPALAETTQNTYHIALKPAMVLLILQLPSESLSRLSTSCPSFGTFWPLPTTKFCFLRLPSDSPRNTPYPGASPGP